MNLIHPVDLPDFLATFWASAGIILSGAAYALFYALAKLKRQGRLLYAAACSFALVSVCVCILIQTAHLNGQWRLLAVTMLLVYLLAPPALYRLCQATHT